MRPLLLKAIDWAILLLGDNWHLLISCYPGISWLKSIYRGTPGRLWIRVIGEEPHILAEHDQYGVKYPRRIELAIDQGRGLYRIDYVRGEYVGGEIDTTSNITSLTPGGISVASSEIYHLLSNMDGKLPSLRWLREIEIPELLHPRTEEYGHPRTQNTVGSKSQDQDQDR